MHTMTMTERAATGSELWECDECSRKLFVTWESFHRDVLIAGEAEVVHAGGRGGVSFVGGHVS